MTWKKIIDNNLEDEFWRKADAQPYVYLLFDAEPPHTVIDLAYSLYEVAVKYFAPYKTIRRVCEEGRVYRAGGFTIERVFTDYDETELAEAL